jgi:hypothetical protein
MSNSRNKNTRLELLIVLDYLLNFTNADHIPQHEDYLVYAVTTYQYAIKDRQHVREILDHLFALNQTHPKLLPFKIEAYNTGVRKKYYVTHKGLKDEEIKGILSALQNNVYTPKDIAHDLAHTLLPLVTNQHELKAYEDYMLLKNKAVTKVSKRVIEKMIQLDFAINKRALVELVLYEKPDKTYFLGTRPLRQPTRSIRGYVDRLYDHHNQPYVLLNNRMTNKLESYVITSIHHVNVFDMDDRIDRLPTTEERYRDPSYPDATSNLKAAVNPLPEGQVVTVQFRFLHSDYVRGFISESFKTYFKQTMPRAQERMEPLISFLKDKTADVDPRHEVNVMYVEFQVNSLAYVKWATSYDVARLIETLAPNTVTEDIKQHYLHLLSMSNFVAQ